MDIAFFVFISSLFVLKASVASANENGSLQLGVLIPWTGDWQIGGSIASAVGIAISEISNRQLLRDYTVDWEWIDTECSALPGVSAAVQLYKNTDDLDAYIGGGCSEVCEPVALNAQALNIPFVSFGCTSLGLSDKELYPTFTRSNGPWLAMAPMMNKLLDWFGWDRVAVIDTPADIFRSTAYSIKEVLESSGKTVLGVTIPSSHRRDELVEDVVEEQRLALQNFGLKEKVFILVMMDFDIQTTLLAAYDLGMMDGNSVFITIEASLYSAAIQDYRPEDTRRAYQGLITARNTVPYTSSWEEFAQEVIDGFQTDPKFDEYRSTHLPADAEVAEVDLHAGMLYDAVLMWAYGVNITLESGGPVDSGINITHSIINAVDFNSTTGRVKTNSNGDRDMDYSITINQNGEWVEMLIWYGHGVKRIKKIYMSDEADDYWEGIIWPGNATTPPIGEPECGWDGENCPALSVAELATLISLLLLLLVCLLALAILFHCYRKRTFEEQLKSMINRLVQYSQLTTNVMSSMIASTRMLKTGEAVGLNPNEGRDLPKIYDYKQGQSQQTVILKRLDKPSITINREIMLDMKAVCDISHPNLNRFVGAITDSPNVSLLWEYTGRGSLKDVITNRDYNINWEFKMSFASDIARGMEYLHASPIGSHGHLTSSNCVISSRWVCKVSDYGLGRFRSHNTRPLHYKDPEQLLWTAPELLRMSEPPLLGTPEGDVYSYGIVLHELLLNGRAFGDLAASMRAAEIVQKVRTSTTQQPLRPVISTGSCAKVWRALVEDCWAEDPSVRPDFSRVYIMLLNINGGHALHMEENIMRNLEQHTEHTEELVQDEQAALTRESSKYETLLHHIVPRSLVIKLAAGDTVEPKQYSDTTLFFSDILGYETLIGNCTPRELVNVLNDLIAKFGEISEDNNVVKLDTANMRRGLVIMISGAPVPDNDHAATMAMISLELMEWVAAYRLPSDSGAVIQLRVALHSGPVLAVLMGQDTPRFSVFGDAMDYTRQLLAASIAWRIHVSKSTATLLEKDGGFELKQLSSDINGVPTPTYCLLKGGNIQAPEIKEPEPVRNILSPVHSPVQTPIEM